MKIILRTDIEHLGKVGDIVSVKPGYARNYLMPQGMAYLADKGSLKRFEDEKRKLLGAADREMNKALALKARLEAGTYVAKVKVGSEGRLYGSVTTHQIAELIQVAGIEIERRTIIQERPIKTLGSRVRDETAAVRVLWHDAPEQGHRHSRAGDCGAAP